MPHSQYVIGDVHGQLDQLEQALTWIKADGGADAAVVFLGDLVDRGPNSRGVIDRIIAGFDAGLPWRVVKGNHDRMFEQFLNHGELHDARIVSGIGWMDPRLGGPATLASYGVADAAVRPIDEVLAEARAAVPAAHKSFVSGLPLLIQQDPLLFVHAGIRPDVALKDQDPDDLIWIRQGFLEDPRPHPWLVVHGHTALERPARYANRVNLDGGAGYGRPLYPAVFEGRDCWLLNDNGRTPL